MNRPDTGTDMVRFAVQALADRRPVLLVTAAGTGNLVSAAGCASTELVSFMVRHTSGFLCVALPAPECERLSLPAMRASDDSPDEAGGRASVDYRVTVDAREGVSTGISARDRARTVALLADPRSVPATFARPGHVVPVAARQGGLLERDGDAEAAVDLATLAGFAPAALFAGIVSPRRPERMATGDELVRFGADHGLALVSASALQAYLGAARGHVTRGAASSLPTSAGAARAIGYHTPDGREHLVLVAGSVSGRHAVPVYVHQECLLGDVFGTLRCTCAQRLDRARRAILRSGCGVLIYLRQRGGAGHCPRSGRVGAFGAAGLVTEADGVAALILRDLGVLGTSTLPGLPDELLAALPPSGVA
ncbi:MAG TPA: 3,4-dihydroxy-2-butanone-4-phosphate synthase [Pseudonocardia sp.]|jgi:3,4-dihydroxy 2-butanone 4-phosphate synthase/GTP cyclohydrolase II